MHQKVSTRATQSGTPGQCAVGRKLSSKPSVKENQMKPGRTGNRMREEVNVG
jgi:hypothetical protein